MYGAQEVTPENNYGDGQFRNYYNMVKELAQNAEFQAFDNALQRQHQRNSHQQKDEQDGVFLVVWTHSRRCNFGRRRHSLLLLWQRFRKAFFVAVCRSSIRIVLGW